MGKTRRTTIWILFLLYLLVMLLLLFHRTRTEGYSFNLQPFVTIRGYLRAIRLEHPGSGALRRYGWINLMGNLLAFVPLGVFLPCLFRPQRRFWLFLLTATALVCAVELLQFSTRAGALDVDDLILNLPGACLGWLLWRGLAGKARKDA